MGSESHGTLHTTPAAGLGRELMQPGPTPSRENQSLGEHMGSLTPQGGIHNHRGKVQSVHVSANGSAPG